MRHISFLWCLLALPVMAQVDRATITGTLLLCDTWLNIIPTTGAARSEAIALAFLELPLAAL